MVILPNFIRFAMTVLCGGTFVPQLQRLWARKDSAGLRTSYVLFLLLSATEHFAVFVGAPGWFSNGSDAGKALNVLHYAVIFAFSLAVFVLHLRFTTADTRLANFVFTFFACSSLLVMALFSLVFTPRADGITGLPRDAIVVLHLTFVLPFVAILRILAFVLQYREIEPRCTSTTALSLATLAAQAVVFTVDSILWTMRADYPDELDYGDNFDLFRWYIFPGWPVVDGLVFAIGQAVLLYRAQGSFSLPWSQMGNSMGPGIKLGGVRGTSMA